MSTKQRPATGFDQSIAETYGVNEIRDAVQTLEEGDTLELDVSFMTEAAGVLGDTFRADVDVVNQTEYGVRIELETAEHAFAPLRDGDWYMNGATAMREGSHIPYGIERLRVCRAANQEAGR